MLSVHVTRGVRVCKGSRAGVGDALLHCMGIRAERAGLGEQGSSCTEARIAGGAGVVSVSSTQSAGAGLVASCAVSGSVEIDTIAWTAAASLIQSGRLGV